LTAAIDADSAAFNDVLTVMKLPKDTPEQKTARDQRIQLATQRATEVPLSVARACVDMLELIHVVAAHGNVNAMSDAATAAHMARAAIESAGMNIRINAASLGNKEQVDTYIEELSGLRTRAATWITGTLAEVERRATLA
jgi:formiminotetrahydrofolate cyclodeaminase